MFLSINNILCNAYGCNKSSTGVCKQCKKTQYCSETCQKNDKQRHNKECYEIKTVKRKRVFNQLDWFNLIVQRGSYYELKDMLLLTGANIDCTDRNGMTALVLVLNLKQSSYFKMLIDNGADVNIQTDIGMTALMHAYNDIPKVKALIAAGANINCQDHTGTTFLMRASQNYLTEIVRILINAGAKLNIQNKKGSTALILASYCILSHSFDIEVFNLLISAGANLQLKTKKNNTALMYTAKNCHSVPGIMCTELLLAAGANVKVNDSMDQCIEYELCFDKTCKILILTKLLEQTLKSNSEFYAKRHAILKDKNIWKLIFQNKWILENPNSGNHHRALGFNMNIASHKTLKSMLVNEIVVRIHLLLESGAIMSPNTLVYLKKKTKDSKHYLETFINNIHKYVNTTKPLTNTKLFEALVIQSNLTWPVCEKNK